LNLDKSTALIAGAAQWQNGEKRALSPLNYITDELNEFEKLRVARSRLEGENFTLNKFQKKVADLPVQIIHIATHAKFSSDPEQTRIEAYDQPITLKELRNLLQSKTQSSLDNIELLVLSACQTAKGDKRSGLGLAGVALQAGARSTVASLWNVNDSSTPKFMKEFYERLKDGETKAEALRQAQLAFLEDEKYSNFRHPYYWAIYILPGSTWQRLSESSHSTGGSFAKQYSPTRTLLSLEISQLFPSPKQTKATFAPAASGKVSSPHNNCPASKLESFSTW
jgi:CHAT domain-containing protein